MKIEIPVVDLRNQMSGCRPITDSETGKNDRGT
jgi:hypothetical protein